MRWLATFITGEGEVAEIAARGASAGVSRRDNLAVGLERYISRTVQPPKSVVCVPSPEKLWSSEPSGL